MLSARRQHVAIFILIFHCFTFVAINGQTTFTVTTDEPTTELPIDLNEDDEVSHIEPLSSLNEDNVLTREEPGQVVDDLDSEAASFTEVVVKPSNDARERNGKVDGKQSGPNPGPSVEDLISGIIQLIGGNTKLGRPSQPQLPKPQLPPVMIPDMTDFGGSRINNRFPGKPYHPNGQGLPAGIMILPGQSSGAGQPIPLGSIHKSQVRPPPQSNQHSRYPQDHPGYMGHPMKPAFPQNQVINLDPRWPPAPPMPPPARTPSYTTVDSATRIPSKPAMPVHIHDNSQLIISFAASSSSTKQSPNQITPSTSVTQITASADSNDRGTIKVDDHQLTKHFSAQSTPPLMTATKEQSTRAANQTKYNDRESYSNVDYTEETISETEWLPVDHQSVRPTKTWTDEPPVIITADEGPSVFDITLKHKVGPGASGSAVTTAGVRPVVTSRVISSSSVSPAPIYSMSSSVLTETPELKTSSDPKRTAAVISTSLSQATTSSKTTVSVTPTPRLPNSVGNRKTVTKSDEEVVYGKRAQEQARPVAPSVPDVTLMASGVMSTSSREDSTRTHTPGMGRPIIIPVDVDEVKPVAGRKGSSTRNNNQVITEAGHGQSVFIDGRPTHFKIKPAGVGQPTLQVGSGVTVNVAGNDVPARPDNLGLVSGNSPKNSVTGIGSAVPKPTGTGQVTASSSKPVVKRPPFRLRPQVPLVRIDTCIVGDDSTCDVKSHEKCKTELGISSCQCKPGFGRAAARGMCFPVSTMAVFIRVDKIGDKKLSFTRNYLNPSSEEYQLLEYESIQSLISMFSLSRLSKAFIGAKVNKFYTQFGKLLVNATVELEATNSTKHSTIKKIVQQELSRVVALRHNHLGDSQLWVDSSVNAVSKVDDINECSASDLHDCSPLAKCINQFGEFRCVCRPGYEDKFPLDPKRSGRHCASCSPAFCSNRGDCVIEEGEKVCKCKGNYIGSKCDIDGEVVGVAVGGSIAALVIIIVTFLCLYMWNQRWKKEQQKMEAMSAASAQTFSYVNKQQQLNAYRYAIDDRNFRWANHEAANYYASPEHLMAASSQQHYGPGPGQPQHLYATPSRVATPDDLLVSDDLLESRHYASTATRNMRSKSRNSTMHGHYQAPTLPMGPGSVYNETEFSTRETLYTPSHLVLTTPRAKYALYS
ncbi:63 kDa sperm flagellar membrane protein [Halotydeus destructor]|nr:63 kDa sperm flagellar membrane protein [Halotydeus destructor]